MNYWYGTRKKTNTETYQKYSGKIRQNKYDVVVNVQRFAATGLLTVFRKPNNYWI
jgi:hypothetical protein